MTTQEKRSILKGFKNLGKEIQKQKSEEKITDSLKASIFYEQHKNDPRFEGKINELKAQYGKLGLDYNGLAPVHPISENKDNLHLFKEAAAELGHEFKSMSVLHRVGTVIINIYSESVHFAGLRNSHRVMTYSITKEQVKQALIETL